MKKKILLVCLVSVFTLSFLAATQAHAAWFSDADVIFCQAKDNGHYRIKLQTTSGWAKVFTINNSSPNKNALLAVFLTATSTGQKVSIEYDASSYVIQARLLA